MAIKSKACYYGVLGDFSRMVKFYEILSYMYLFKQLLWGIFFRPLINNASVLDLCDFRQLMETAKGQIHCEFIVEFDGTAKCIGFHRTSGILCKQPCVGFFRTPGI